MTIVKLLNLISARMPGYDTLHEPGNAVFYCTIETQLMDADYIIGEAVRQARGKDGQRLVRFVSCRHMMSLQFGEELPHRLLSFRFETLV